jgi:hypothetical protein
MYTHAYFLYCAEAFEVLYPFFLLVTQKLKNKLVCGGTYPNLKLIKFKTLSTGL